MTWVRLDDTMGDHPKIISLSDRAFRLHILGLLYCSRHLTDGRVPERVAHAMVANGKRYAEELVAAGSWDAIAGGYEVHDYGEFQLSKAQVLEQRAKTAARVAGWRQRHRNGVTGALVTGAPVTDPVPAHPQTKGQPPVQSNNGTDHVKASKGISPGVKESMNRLADVLSDKDRGTVGRLVKLARRGASQADFEDARSAVLACPAERPSAYACQVIHNRLKERGA